MRRETEALAGSLPDAGGVYLVPAFTGLGAPHWDPDARGAIYGLTRDTGPAHLARAALESVCLQTRDLIAAMEADSGAAIDRLRVDGGMVANTWLLQALADIVGVTVERPRNAETTALGAAYLADCRWAYSDPSTKSPRDGCGTPNSPPGCRTGIADGSCGAGRARWRAPWSTAAEAVPASALRGRGGRPPLRLAYCATDFGVGTMRVTRIAERSISSVTRGATSFFQ